MHKPLLPDAIGSVGVLLLALAAADDITTGHEPDFRLEYVVLAAAAIWFAVVSVRLMRAGFPVLGAITGLALLAAVWGRDAIRPGVTPGFWPEYIASTGAFVWFAGLAVMLVCLTWRRRSLAGR